MGPHSLRSVLSCGWRFRAASLRVDCSRKPDTRTGSVRRRGWVDGRFFGSLPHHENQDCLVDLLATAAALSFRGRGILAAAVLAAHGNLLWLAGRLFGRRGPLGARLWLCFLRGHRSVGAAYPRV